MRIKPVIITVFVLIISIGSLFYFKNIQTNNQASMVMPEPVISVEAQYISSKEYKKTTSLIGQAQAVQHANIINELAGKITKVNFASGAKVEQGQVLFELNHAEESALLKSAKADSQLNKQTLERYMSLQKTGRISDDKVDLANAQLVKSLAEIERISAIINKKVIKSPFSGYIGIHDLSVGQYIDSNTQITELVGNNEHIWIDFNVPQTYPELALNAKITVIDKATSQTALAEIVSISPVLNQASRQTKYRSKVLIADLSVKPNQLVKVKFPLTLATDVLLVPQLAVVRDQLGDYVFVLNKANDEFRAMPVKVELGDRVGDKVIIKSGVEKGTLIATQGSFKLRQGVKAAITLKDSVEG